MLGDTDVSYFRMKYFRHKQNSMWETHIILQLPFTCLFFCMELFVNVTVFGVTVFNVAVCPKQSPNFSSLKTLKFRP